MHVQRDAVNDKFMRHKVGRSKRAAARIRVNHALLVVENSEPGSPGYFIGNWMLHQG